GRAVTKRTAPPRARQASASARLRRTWPAPRRASASARTSSGGSSRLACIGVCYFPHGFDHVARVGVAHRRKNRQRENLLVGGLGNRAQPFAGPEALAVIRMQM